MADPAPPTAAGAGVQIAEQPIGQILLLRLGPGAVSVVPAFEPILGAPLPVEPNRTSGDDPRLYWLAPHEWAIISRAEAPDLAARLSDAARGQLHHVADLMRGWLRFEVDGAGARDLLSAGCSLDLHPRAFARGACAQTLLAEMPVLIEQPSEGRFLVHVDRSFAAHLRTWFSDAAAGGPLARPGERQ